MMIMAANTDRDRVRERRVDDFLETFYHLTVSASHTNYTKDKLFLLPPDELANLLKEIATIELDEITLQERVKELLERRKISVAEGLLCFQHILMRFRGDWVIKD